MQNAVFICRIYGTKVCQFKEKKFKEKFSSKLDFYDAGGSEKPFNFFEWPNCVCLSG